MRTNNPAESVHAQLNKDAGGNLTLHSFLSIIEKQMKRSADRIASGCENESRAVIPEKNRLLAIELFKFLNGKQGVLPFLDNCASVVCLKSLAAASKYVPVSLTTFADVAWSADHRDLVKRSARQLFSSLSPIGQSSDEEILKTVTDWAFQVLPDTQVPDYEDSELSLVENQPRRSFIELREAVREELLGDDPSDVPLHVLPVSVPPIPPPTQDYWQSRFNARSAPTWPMAPHPALWWMWMNRMR